MSTIRPTLKLKLKTPPVLPQKKLEVYIPDKANVITKPKSATLSLKTLKLKDNHVAKETNSGRNKINKNTSAVKPDQEIINARRARHKAQYQEVLHITKALSALFYHTSKTISCRYP